MHVHRSADQRIVPEYHSRSAALPGIDSRNTGSISSKSVVLDKHILGAPRRIRLPREPCTESGGRCAAIFRGVVKFSPKRYGALNVSSESIVINKSYYRAIEMKIVSTGRVVPINMIDADRAVKHSRLIVIRLKRNSR